MKLCFTLRMPNVGSWNGRWSGENNLYARIISIGRSNIAIEKAKEIMAKGYYYYDFGDGWGAAITVKEVDAKEAAKIERKSKGFCGYEWMIRSIQEIGIIKPPSQRSDHEQKASNNKAC